MNKVVQNFLLILLPLYPFWAWFSYSLVERDLSIFVVSLLIPFAIYAIVIQRIKIPKYLIFLILFTIYHLWSIFVNDLLPVDGKLYYFILTDPNVFACIIFIVIESTHFDERFITRMNKRIFLLVIITFLVSIIQIKYPSFFVSPAISANIDRIGYLEENRNFSIFSWIDINSLGISFPILIAILLSVSGTNKKNTPITIIIGVVVSFLTRARYVMVSAIIVLSQLFFNSKADLRKKVYTIVLFIGILLVLVGVASIYGYNIRQVIDNRILEKETGMGSARVRVTSYEVFLLKFPEFPWFGVGPETREDVLELLQGSAPVIHVGYLSYLYFYGIFGALLIFLSIFYLLKYAWLTGKKDAFWGSFYGLLSFCFANITFVYFNLSEIGVILAIVYLKYYKEKSSDLSESEIILEENNTR